jgi:hypothetical protein
MPAFLADDLGRYMVEIPTAADFIVFPSKTATYLR